MTPVQGAWPTLEDMRHPVPALYVVALPIGNPFDITLRALAVLRDVDAVVCEDTRRTHTLLASYQLKQSLLIYHDFSTERTRQAILSRITTRQQHIALVSDAGTPLVSDPGYKLLEMARELHIPIIALPGASAVLTGLVLAGMPTHRFVFEGFLPKEIPTQQRILRRLAGLDASLVFFESMRRLPETLHSMAAMLGERPVAVLREMTKPYEETMRYATLTEAAQDHAANPRKGEATLVVAPASAMAQTADLALDDLPSFSFDTILHALKKQLSTRSIVSALAAQTGLSRTLLYKKAIAVSGPEGDDPASE